MRVRSDVIIAHLGGLLMGLLVRIAVLSLPQANRNFAGGHGVLPDNQHNQAAQNDYLGLPHCSSATCSSAVCCPH